MSKTQLSVDNVGGVMERVQILSEDCFFFHQLDTITIPLSRQETAVVLSSQQQMVLPLLHKKLKNHINMDCPLNLHFSAV